MWICDTKKDHITENEKSSFFFSRLFLWILLQDPVNDLEQQETPFSMGMTKARQPAGRLIPVWRCCQPPSSFPRGDRETSLNPDQEKPQDFNFCLLYRYSPRLLPAHLYRKAPDSIFHSRPDMKLICNKTQHMVRDWSPGRTEAPQ